MQLFGPAEPDRTFVAKLASKPSVGAEELAGTAEHLADAHLGNIAALTSLAMQKATPWARRTLGGLFGGGDEEDGEEEGPAAVAEAAPGGEQGRAAAAAAAASTPSPPPPTPTPTPAHHQPARESLPPTPSDLPPTPHEMSSEVMSEVDLNS